MKALIRLLTASMFAMCLPAQALDLIGVELEKLYDTLDARELSAGSVLARRLFS